MRSGNLAPDHADLGAADLLLATVDEGDLLAEVEAVFALTLVLLPSPSFSARDCETYLAAFVLSTPSILIRLVPGWVMLRERW